MKERFFLKVNKCGRLMPGMKTRCHEWTGNFFKTGYGRFWLNGKGEKAHRVAWLLANGSWPEPCGLHRCDNPACVRVDHLFEGTQLENIVDMHAKGRASGGSHSGSS